MSIYVPGGGWDHTDTLASYPGLQIAVGRPGIHCLHMHLKYYVNFNCDVCEWVGLNR